MVRLYEPSQGQELIPEMRSENLVLKSCRKKLVLLPARETRAGKKYQHCNHAELPGSPALQIVFSNHQQPC